MHAKMRTCSVVALTMLAVPIHAYGVGRSESVKLEVVASDFDRAQENRFTGRTSIALTQTQCTRSPRARCRPTRMGSSQYAVSQSAEKAGETGWY